MQDEIESGMTQRTIGRYLAALSNGSPTPGGGSAAGLAGALGCALGSMVCNLTLARESSDSVAEQQRTYLDLQRSMLAQAEADERVFGAYREAAAMPRKTDEEKRARREAIERTLVAAAEVPLELATLGLAALSVLRTTAGVGTSHAVGDLLTGGFLLQAMVRGSLENIEANAHLMKQPENKQRFEQAASSAQSDLEAAMVELDSAVAARRNG
ncbi:MAG TPA: cyclodeaminase/cyclohydrolase family protein [Thermomicrobiales bacterium]|nr:cyclodeaminase/cyclohydrolase family protein [Thermomicrobiales bacterium]